MDLSTDFPGVPFFKLLATGFRHFDGIKSSKIQPVATAAFFNVCEFFKILCHLSFGRIPAGHIPARRGFLVRRVIKYSLWSRDNHTTELFCQWGKDENPGAAQVR